MCYLIIIKSNYFSVMGFYEPDTVYAPFLFPTLVKWHASLLHRSKKILYAKLPSGLQQPSYLINVELI